MWRRSMIVGSPFLEMVCNIKGRCVWGSVLKVNHDDLVGFGLVAIKTTSVREYALDGVQEDPL